jgi:hypothetical protein
MYTSSQLSPLGIQRAQNFNILKVTYRRKSDNLEELGNFFIEIIDTQIQVKVDSSLGGGGVHLDQ